ncbi:MAG: hypothetical protein K0S86_2527 [Geminicoccaceae bacterium]|jgi:hypothetical protein|nr:hypothetical protein [Geminicoccaceae bacterium]
MATLLDAVNKHLLPHPTFYPPPRARRAAPTETLA